MMRVTIALTVLVCASSVRAAEHARVEVEPAPEPAAVIEQAEARDRVEPKMSSNEPESRAVEAAANGALSTFALSPAVPHLANGLALAGYDGAAQGLRARSAVDGRLLGFLAARVEYEHGLANGPSDRVSLGLRASLLNQAAHGVDFGALLFYQPRDFREEGDVALGLLLARRFDRFTLVLNSLVGSDPEGDDQSFELRLAGLYKLDAHWVFGFDGRGRYNLSEDEKRTGHSVMAWDAQGGVTAAFGVGPLLLSGLVGPSLLERSDFGLDGSSGDRLLRAGLLAMAGAGASF